MTAGLGQQLWLGLLSGVVLTVFSTGLVLLFGVMRVVNMAHGALFMLGAMFTFDIQSRLGHPLPQLRSSASSGSASPALRSTDSRCGPWSEGTPPVLRALRLPRYWRQ